MKEENLTLYDIQRASTNYLKSCSKYDIDVEVQDMIDKELYIREHRRPIGLLVSLTSNNSYVTMSCNSTSISSFKSDLK